MEFQSFLIVLVMRLGLKANIYFRNTTHDQTCIKIDGSYQSFTPSHVVPYLANLKELITFNCDNT